MSRSSACKHLGEATAATPRTEDGCEECLKIGSPWVHLRLCLTCGHMGCCDDSPMRHATAHFHSSTHPVIKSYEPGETWGWCYVDEVADDPVPGPTPRHHISPPHR